MATTYTIDPVFKLPTQFWSTDMAYNVLGNDVDPNVVQRAREVFTKSMNLTDGVNDLHALRGFFIDYILLGTKTAKGYPPAVLPSVMRNYGINWRDFIHEYGGDDKKRTEDRTRAVIVQTALWVACAYWLTPDWLYNANYPEMINYRRWIYPTALPFAPWADAIRANPCVFEEGIRQAMQPWIAKVIDPLIKERRHWALRNFGPGHHPKDVKLAIPAVFYLGIYNATLKEWYAQAQATVGKLGAPIMQLPKRESQRRVSQKQKGEQQGSRTSPNQSNQPKSTWGNSGIAVKSGKSRPKAAQTNEHTKREPLAQDSAPTGGNSRAVDWTAIPLGTKTPEQWMDAVLAAGIRDKIMTFPADARFGALMPIFYKAGGTKAQREEIRALLPRLEGIPSTGSVRDEREYAQMQADHEAVKDTLRTEAGDPAPSEPAPTPPGGYYADTPELTEAELAQEPAPTVGVGKASVRPPDGGQPFLPVGGN